MGTLFLLAVHATKPFGRGRSTRCRLLYGSFPFARGHPGAGKRCLNVRPASLRSLTGILISKCHHLPSASPKQKATDHLDLIEVAGCAAGSACPLGAHVERGGLLCLYTSGFPFSQVSMVTIPWGLSRPVPFTPNFLELRVCELRRIPKKAKFTSGIMHSSGPIQQVVLCIASRVHSATYIRHC
jgi:hypothetical protein